MTSIQNDYISLSSFSGLCHWLLQLLSFYTMSWHKWNVQETLWINKMTAHVRMQLCAKDVQEK